MTYPSRLIFDSPLKKGPLRKPNRKAERHFKQILTNAGCSEEVVDEMWILYKSGAIQSA